MLDLVDILDRVKENGMESVDNSTIKTLQKLSERIESPIQEEESRLQAYHSGLKEFTSGLDDGFQKEQYSTGTGETIYHGLGRITGRDIYSNIEVGKLSKNSTQTESYQKFLEDLKKSLNLVDSELGELNRAVQDPLSYLYAQFQIGIGFDKNIGEGLVRILTTYKDLTEEILRGKSDSGFVEKLAGKTKKTFDDHMQLGIAYIFSGRLEYAATHFNEARKNVTNQELNDPLRDVAGNISNANTIIKLPYSKIRFAQEFERAGIQHNPNT